MRIFDCFSFCSDSFKINYPETSKMKTFNFKITHSIFSSKILVFNTVLSGVYFWNLLKFQILSILPVIILCFH